MLVKLNPIDYAPNSSTAQWQNRWRQGYNALKKRTDVSLVIQGSSQERPYGDYPYDHPGSDRSKVLAEMELEIQVPGVRVVADPLFTTMGSFMSNDIIESVNSQIKAKAKFVGNPDMKSSQIIEIKNVGKSTLVTGMQKRLNIALIPGDISLRLLLRRSHVTLY